jgi:hypothetical protein
MLKGIQAHIQSVKAIRQMPTFENMARKSAPNGRATSTSTMMIRTERNADPVTMSMISGNRPYTTNTKTAVR